MDSCRKRKCSNRPLLLATLIVTLTLSISSTSNGDGRGGECDDDSPLCLLKWEAQRKAQRNRALSGSVSENGVEVPVPTTEHRVINRSRKRIIDEGSLPETVNEDSTSVNIEQVDPGLPDDAPKTTVGVEAPVESSPIIFVNDYIKVIGLADRTEIYFPRRYVKDANKRQISSNEIALELKTKHYKKLRRSLIQSDLIADVEWKRKKRRNRFSLMHLETIRSIVDVKKEGYESPDLDFKFVLFHDFSQADLAHSTPDRQRHTEPSAHSLDRDEQRAHENQVQNDSSNPENTSVQESPQREVSNESDPIVVSSAPSTEVEVVRPTIREQFLVARQNYENGETKNSLEKMNSLRNQLDTNSHLHLEISETLANLYLLDGAFDRALQEFAQVLDRDSDWSFPHARVGYAAARRQQFRALDDYSVDMLESFLNYVEAGGNNTIEPLRNSRMSARKLLEDHYSRESRVISSSEQQAESETTTGSSVSSDAVQPLLTIETIQSEEDIKNILEDDLFALSPMNVVHLWRTDCGPCLTELPELFKRIAVEPEVNMLVVSTDEFDGDAVYDYLYNAFKTANRNQTTNIGLYHDPGNYFSKELQSAREQKNGMVPSTIFLRSDQRVGVKVGAVDWAAFDKNKVWK